jgi:hypothetical protein
LHFLIVDLFYQSRSSRIILCAGNVIIDTNFGEIEVVLVDDDDVATTSMALFDC